MTIEVTFAWVDDDAAGLESFVCLCGNEVDYTLTSEQMRYVHNGVILACPKCGRRYKAVWLGMQLEPTEDKDDDTSIQ